MKRILVIEDEAIIRLHTLNLLQSNGFDAVGTGDGLVGVQLAREFLPDLILCNLNLPGLNGFEILRELRNDPATATIPLIFVTAQSSPDEIEQMLQLGAESYITKPFTPEELLQAIANILG